MGHSDRYQDILIKPGMEEHIDARLLPMGTPRLLQNVRTRQAARFEKRPGTEALPTSRLPYAGNGVWMGDWNGSPVAGIHETLTTGQEDTGVWIGNGTHWGYAGRHGLCVPHRRFGIAGRENDTPYKAEGAVAANGLLYCVYWDDVAADVVYLQERTPEGVATRALSVSGTCPRLVWTGAVLYIIVNDGGTVKVRQVNLAAFTLATAVSLPSAAEGSTTPIDAAPLESSTDWLICYRGSATELYVRRMQGTAASASASVLTTSTPLNYSIAGHSTHGVLVTYTDGAAAQATIFSAVLGGATEITLDASGAWFTQLVMVRVNTDKFLVLLTEENTATAGLTTVITHAGVVTTSGGGSYAGVNSLAHLLPAGKPMRVGADGDAAVYCWMHNGYGSWATADQARHILVDFEYQTGGFGSQLAGVAYEHQPVQGDARMTGAPADLGDGRFAQLLNWSDPNGYAGLDCAVFSLAAPSTSMAQTHRFADTSGGALYVSGACLSDVGNPVIVQPNSSDAACFIPENGFAHAPLISGERATGGSMTPGMAYTWQALYRQIDGLGRVHRSSAGLIATGIVATGTYMKANLYVAAAAITNRSRAPGERVVVEGYRSWNGGAYYFIGDTESTYGAVSVTLSDTLSDTAAEANHVLYTDEGILPTEPPSGAALMCQGGQRMAVRTWRANVGQYSKLYLAGTPWEFVDDDTFRVTFPDDITAIGFMDGAWVWFSASRIYLVTGDGPNDQGVGAFSEPRQLPAAVGADSPHVVEVAEGLLYKGGGTIWLLPRGFGPPAPVGDAIQETLGRFPNLRAAFRAVNADDDCTHFVLASSDTPSASGYVAVYDNRFGSWSLDDIGGEVGAAGAVGGEFTWALPQWSATTHLPIRQFDVSQYQDYSAQGASLFYQQRIEFGDWRPGGIVGQARLGRIGVLGAYGGAGSPPLNAALTVDGTAEPVRTLSVNGTADDGFFREIVPKTQAGTAWQLSLYDSQPSLFTPSYAVNALGIEVDAEPGLRRPGEGERQ